ncbi:MAG TPA: large-conductance mechanosensitive channel protein MscL [Thermoclostridium sp.]|nr:large-conductance mechanosensitive channel protein MscL [Thermoclostridium sp.]
MLKEFKKFALKGNVIDMAVGVVIGGAFGKIVTSLVNDIIMPLLGIVLGQINLKHLKFIIKPAEGDIAELAVLFGQFLQNIIDFLIIALSIFMVVKMITSLKTRAEKMKKKEEEQKPQEPLKPSNEEVLLTEIRDLLKEQK